nr:hypothetical protein [Ningiella ruwaisensis]
MPIRLLSASNGLSGLKNRYLLGMLGFAENSHSKDKHSLNLSA